MSINQRKHIRFSLDIPAIIYSKFGEKQETRLDQISVGGCFTCWEEDDGTLMVVVNSVCGCAAGGVRPGIAMALQASPNKNYLPLNCRAMYRFDHTGIGVKFIDISEFEQELISKIIANKLELEGVPLQTDPFTSPSTFVGEDEATPRITDIRQKRDAVLQRIMSGD